MTSQLNAADPVIPVGAIVVRTRSSSNPVVRVTVGRPEASIGCRSSAYNVMPAEVGEDEVPPSPPNQPVAADAVIESVVERPSAKHVSAASGEDLVVTVAAERSVVASATVDDVCVAATTQDVVSATPADPVQPAGAADHIVPWSPNETIVARGAIDRAPRRGDARRGCEHGQARQDDRTHRLHALRDGRRPPTVPTVISGVVPTRRTLDGVCRGERFDGAARALGLANAGWTGPWLLARYGVYAAVRALIKMVRT